MTEIVAINDGTVNIQFTTKSLTETVAINDGTVNARTTGKSLTETVAISAVVSTQFALNPIISHIYDEVTTRKTTTSATYVNVTDSSITSGNFTAGKKYLIIATAQFDGSSIASNAMVRLAHGSTAFAGSNMTKEPMAVTTQEYTYGYWTVWTAVSGEDVSLQFACEGGCTVGVDNIGLFAMNLSDDLTENTDWFVSENSTSIPHSTTFKTGAQITFTPATAGHDWLVLAKDNVNFDESTPATNAEFRIERYGEATSLFPLLTEEGEDAGGSALDGNAWMLIRNYTLGAVSNTFAVGVRDAAAFTPQHRSNFTGIFALDMDKFKNNNQTYTE
ncbi:MAG: hypothetical protein ACRD32_05060, partial [Nitrososphaerales archaeon]